MLINLPLLASVFLVLINDGNGSIFFYLSDVLSRINLQSFCPLLVKMFFLKNLK